MTGEYTLTDYDAVVLDQEDLDAFMDEHSDCEGLMASIDVFTEDDSTTGMAEFNYLVGSPEFHRIATQVQIPFDDDDTVLDLRDEPDGSADREMGLTPN